MTRKSDLRAMIVLVIVLVGGALLGFLRRADAEAPASRPPAVHGETATAAGDTPHD